MDEDVLKTICRDRQITKFRFYGFFKNLKFFEPYLILFLLSKHLNLFQIGLLISIRELIINFFEIPSGIVADYWGKKKELYCCFLFYILSFFLFFLTDSFLLGALAMISFGFGEAFRSGTHKAMIYIYLEKKGWQEYKSFVYGRTRGASLVGSALSSLVAILLALSLPDLNYIFLFSIVPYVLDLLLIASYPNYLDAPGKSTSVCLSAFLKRMFLGLKSNSSLRRLLLAEGLFEGSVSSIKDLVQPILESLAMASGIVLIANLSQKDNLNVLLGLLYMIINIAGVFASRNSYRLIKRFKAPRLLNLAQLLLIISILIIGMLIKQPVVVCLAFLVINMTRDARKPLYIDVIDDNMEKEERATMLSLGSQLKSIFTVVIAPAIGYVADTYSLSKGFVALALLLLVIFPFSWNSKGEK